MTGAARPAPEPVALVARDYGHAWRMYWQICLNALAVSVLRDDRVPVLSVPQSIPFESRTNYTGSDLAGEYAVRAEALRTQTAALIVARRNQQYDLVVRAERAVERTRTALERLDREMRPTADTLAGHAVTVPTTKPVRQGSREQFVLRVPEVRVHVGPLATVYLAPALRAEVTVPESTPGLHAYRRTQDYAGGAWTLYYIEKGRGPRLNRRTHTPEHAEMFADLLRPYRVPLVERLDCYALALR